MWLLIASPLTGHPLYLKTALAPLNPPPSPAIHAAWTSSLSGAVQHVLAPLMSAGLLAPAAAWAIGAAVLPLIYSRRSRLLTGLSACLWAGGVVGGVALALKTGGGGHGLILVGEGVVGAVASVVAAVAPDIAQRKRGWLDLADADPQLP
jgi:hypothetical protein